MNAKWWRIVLALGLIAGLGYAGYAVWGSSPAQAQGSTRETTTVRRGRLVMTVDGTGSLAPRADVELAFLAGGPVAEVLVEEGERVEADQPLIRLETDELVSQLIQAKARLTSAEAQLAQLMADPEAEEVTELEANLRAAQAQVAAAAAQRDQTMGGPSEPEVAEAQAQVSSAEADYRNALIAYDTTDEEDEDQREQARYDLWAAEVALEAARTQLEEVQAGPDADDVRAAKADVAEAVKRRDAAQAQLALLLAGPSQEQVEATRAAVEQARVALASAQLQLERATLSAPSPGTIVALEVSVGEVASAGQTVAVLNDLSALEVEINVDETDVAQVHVGQRAQITLDAFPEAQLTGEVTYVAPRAGVRAGVVFFPVTVRLTDPAHELPVKAGMTADVEIVAARQENALIVPLRAVHSEGERTYVERLVDSRTEQVEVALGMMTDTQVEVSDGGRTSSLREGDVVIVVPGAEQNDGLRLPNPFGGGN